MLENIRQISVFGKIFNVRGNEWPKIGLSWVVRLLYRIGFVIGWTIIVGMFVSRYGIVALPYLFVVNAFFTILGSVFYSTFLDKFSKPKIMIATIFIAIVLLLTAVAFSVNNSVFFALLIVAEAIFLVQFKILMDAFIEELFTPLESERTFPLIESAETLGGITAGLLVVFLSNSIEIYKFVFIWAGLLALIIPCILFYGRVVDEIVLLKAKKTKKRAISFVAKVRKQLSSTKQLSFIKGLFLIVLVQWFLFNLVEFQYTKAVYQSVSSVVMDSGSGFEHSLVHDLGALFILFSSVSLLVQLFIGSRLISSLGIVGSMLLHPVVTLFSLMSLVFSFSFPAAVLLKNNFTVTGILHMNAYHSSYYVIGEKIREHVREFLEGIVRPVGALLGTLTIIILQFIFEFSEMILAVNVMMIVAAMTLLTITYREQKKYTDLAVEDLVRSKEKCERLNAIDILAQKGHKRSMPILLELLHEPTEDVSIRVKILRALGELQDVSTVPDIIKCFDSDVSEIRLAAVQSLLFFKVLQKSHGKYLFAKYELLGALKKLYQLDVNEEIRSKIIALLSTLSTVATIEFLLTILNRSRGNLRADALHALGKYNDEFVIPFVKPFLKSKNAKYRVNAAIALGKFKDCEHNAMHIIYGLLYSEKPSEIALGLFAIGELRLKRKKRLCFKYLDSKNFELKMNAAVALAKMGHNKAIPVIVDILLSDNFKAAQNLKLMLPNIGVRISKNIDKIVRHIISRKIEEILEDDGEAYLEKLKEKKLLSLRWWYVLVDRYDEVENINKILEST